MALSRATSSVDPNLRGHSGVDDNPMDGQERKMIFLKNFLIMAGYVIGFVFLFLVTVAIGSVLQVIVNTYGVPLWIQWIVGLGIAICLFGALVKTSFEKTK